MTDQLGLADTPEAKGGWNYSITLFQAVLRQADQLIIFREAKMKLMEGIKHQLEL